MLSSWTSVTGWPRGELNLLMGRPAAEMSCLCRLCPAPAECPGYAVALVTGRVGYPLGWRGHRSPSLLSGEVCDGVLGSPMGWRGHGSLLFSGAPLAFILFSRVPVWGFPWGGRVTARLVACGNAGDGVSGVAPAVVGSPLALCLLCGHRVPSFSTMRVTGWVGYFLGWRWCGTRWGG